MKRDNQIEGLEQLDHYEKKIYDQKQLLEISKALNSNLEYNILIDSILNICLAQLQTVNAAIFLPPEVESEYLNLDKSSKGFDITDKILGKKLKLDSPLVNFFLERPKSITIQQLNLLGMGDDLEVRFFKDLGAEVLVPLFAKSRVNGLLILGEKINLEEYIESEKEFLTILASLAGVAVENARLYELATVDMMTQLKIHHYFQSKLREEMDRCRKKGTKLALLFTDVDKFKVFNDTHGHQAGDVVLIEVAKKLITSARKNDIAARYGGEEFCVVMPGASLEEGYEMGEKIRKSVEATLVSNPNGGDPLKVTISVGVTEFFPNDKNNKEIIERADKALYQAKHAGRNQTVCFNPS
jgi:diguanylate cyclase (GGDEF)-like protein